MVFQDTVIPSRIDSSSVDGYSIDVNSNSKLEIKPSFQADNIITPIAETSIDIIELQANATITPIDHDTIISDTFSDASGLRDTVNTTNTTAEFNTNKYGTPVSYGSNTTTANLFTGGVDRNGDINFCGIKITTGANKIKLISITQDTTNGTMVRARVGINANGTTPLAEASYVGATATFVTPVILNASTVYYLLHDNNGAAESMDWAATSYPIEVTGITVNKGILSAAEQNEAYGLLKFTYAVGIGVGTGIVEVNLPTIAGTVLATELVINDPNRETGDSVIYTIKNATESDTALAVNTKNNIINLTTVPTKIQINLIPKVSSPTLGTPSCKTYCLKLWKS